jgi:hypothetical protein
VLGFEPVPALNHDVPVQWLAAGDTQLHLFQRDDVTPSTHHVALTVGDLEPVYRRAAELDIFESNTLGYHFHLLPGDIAQLYIRDPTGNLIEIDAPGASALPDDMRAEMRALADLYPQSDEQLRARLFVGT